MYRSEMTSRSRPESSRQIPSFSATLLDKIYRSIDETESRLDDEPMSGKQSKCGSRSSRVAQDPQIDGLLAGDMMAGKKVSGRDVTARRQIPVIRVDDDFFSSNSSSSDSSSGGFSSSDTESIYGVKPRVSSFAPPAIPRPNPVRTSVSSGRPEKSSKTEEKQRRPAMAPLPFDAYRRHPSMEESQLHHDETIIKSKSRALKIYANLKKVKQPISPGGRLSNFINSLFASSGNVKKPKSYDDPNPERRSKSGQASACSSATSFARSCLNKDREKLRDGERRTVRFDPVSVIVGEDLKPCGHKSLYGPDEPTTIRRKNSEDEIRLNAVVERSRTVEVAAREFLRDYNRNQKRNRSSPKESHRAHVDTFDNAFDDTFDDAASCSSSDLFELDNLSFVGSNSRYCEELPVYETTRVGRNLAIANGLMV